MLDNWWLASNNVAVLMKEFFHVNKGVPDFKAKPLAHLECHGSENQRDDEKSRNKQLLD